MIAGGELTGPKARIALLVLLGLTQDRERIRRHFEGDRYTLMEGRSMLRPY